MTNLLKAVYERIVSIIYVSILPIKNILLVPMWKQVSRGGIFRIAHWPIFAMNGVIFTAITIVYHPDVMDAEITSCCNL